MKIKNPHDHSWVFIRSKNYGVMNYDSARGGVDECIRCRQEFYASFILDKLPGHQVPSGRRIYPIVP